MNLDKTQYETSLDLSLYIEGLLNTEEPEVAVKTNLEETIESILVNDLVDSEVENIPVKIEEKVEESNIPVWGQTDFKCLLVKTAGISLMIPAMSISYIERINKKIIRLPLEVEAFRGVITLRERSVAVIDLFTLISENASSENKPSTNIDEHHIEHVIVMENGSYALACDEIGEMTSLERENVRWNKASFNNPLFAGVVPDYLCPIVNIDYVQQQVSAMPFVQSLNENY